MCSDINPWITCNGAKIPRRFFDEVFSHIISVDVFPNFAPLILTIIGEPGTGKSWQVRQIINHFSWNVFELSASQLAGKTEGIVRTNLFNAYEAAAPKHQNSHGVLLIDDFDLSMANIGKNTKTSQHTQLLISSFMELCDRPSSVHYLTHVPIILTANSLEKTYEPLKRHGRMHVYPWIPTIDEIRVISTSILDILPPNIGNNIVELYHEQGIAFFRSLIAEAIKQTIVSRYYEQTTSGAFANRNEIISALQYKNLEFYQNIASSMIKNRQRQSYLSKPTDSASP